MKIDLRIGVIPIVVVTDHWWPSLMTRFNKRTTFITLGKTIYLPGKEIPPASFKHELKHVEQMINLGVVKFVILYLLSFMIKFFTMWNFSKAYEAISYEVEAYEYQKFPLLPYEETAYKELLEGLKT